MTKQASLSATPDALPAGTRLMDYDIEGLLGVGGFGLVYRAREAALLRSVAIKEYLPSSLAQRGGEGQVAWRAPQHEEPFMLGLRSFVNEARLLARFDHPALVRVIRFWEERGTAYMAMPCYEGQTLYEARRALNGPPDEAWLRALMEPLLGALDCLHREQVYHRDVAPDNILILQDLDAPAGIRPVLLDFGAARRVISDHTQALTAILKPSFAPIEQYAETSVLRQGPWTDLYGLGAVLHYSITGRTPVPATARAVHDDLPSLRQMSGALAQDFGRHYSPALLATIDRALAVRPEDRPASVAAWRESLVEQPRTVDLTRGLAPQPEGAVKAQRAEAALPEDTATARAALAGTAADTAAGLAAGSTTASTDGGERDAWTQRTVVVSPTAALPLDGTWPQGATPQPGPGQQGVGKNSGETSGETSPVNAADPRPRTAWAWVLGGAVLSGVVALAAWTLQRDRAAQATGPADAATQQVAQSEGLDTAATGASASTEVSDGGSNRASSTPKPAAMEATPLPPAASGAAAVTGATAGAAADTAADTAAPQSGRREGADKASPSERSAQRGSPGQGQANRRQADVRPTRSTDEAKREAAAPLNPRQACGGKVFIALAICMKRHCSRPAYAQHAECDRMRQQEEAVRQSQRPYP